MRRSLIAAVAGGLSVAGWMAAAQEVDANIDTDGDGAYSLEELQAYHTDADLTEEVFAEIDTDGDGTVSPVEYQAAIDAAVILTPVQ